jgi:uncharacterized protein (DUF1697 family)
MATHLALLRGINVGGHHTVPMADLRSVIGALGHADVRTYIQSGNAVFTAARADPPEMLAQALEAALEEAFGFRPVVVVRTAPGWLASVAADPYPADADPRHVHLGARRHPFTREHQDVLAGLLEAHQAAGGPDHLTVAGADLYLHTPQGLGRSRLADSLSRVGSGMAEVTMRNRATARRLVEMLSPRS